MSDLRRCLTHTGLKVHLTSDPKWKWYPDEKKPYPMGYTLCREHIGRLLYTYEIVDEDDTLLLSDARPVNCLRCRRAAIRDLFRELMTLEGLDMTYEQAQQARCELVVPSSENPDEVIRLTYGNAATAPPLPVE